MTNRRKSPLSNNAVTPAWQQSGKLAVPVAGDLAGFLHRPPGHTAVLPAFRCIVDCLVSHHRANALAGWLGDQVSALIRTSATTLLLFRISLSTVSIHGAFPSLLITKMFGRTYDRYGAIRPKYNSLFKSMQFLEEVPQAALEQPVFT